MTAAGYRIGLDVGGTFTDCACIREDGTTVLTKAPTTRDDESRGCLDALTSAKDAGSLVWEIDPVFVGLQQQAREALVVQVNPMGCALCIRQDSRNGIRAEPVNTFIRLDGLGL